MAVTITADAFADAIGFQPRIDPVRLLAVATEIVTRYAPDAPDVIQNEAVIRTAAWLADSPASGFYESKRGESMYNILRPALTSALRSSGAMSLLRPYKPVGAGVCE